MDRVRGHWLRSYSKTDVTACFIPICLRLPDLVAVTDARLDAEMRASPADSVLARGRIKTSTAAGFAVYEGLACGNAGVEALIMGGVARLVARSRSIEGVMTALDLGFIEIEGSDSLNNPSAVYQSECRIFVSLR